MWMGHLTTSSRENCSPESQWKFTEIETTKSEDIQISFTWRLCRDNSAVWDNRLLFYPTSRYSLDDPQGFTQHFWHELDWTWASNVEILLPSDQLSITATAVIKDWTMTAPHQHDSRETPLLSWFGPSYQWSLDAVQYRAVTKMLCTHTNLSAKEQGWPHDQGESYILSFPSCLLIHWLQNFSSKLKEHLLPHIQAALHQEAESCLDQSGIRTTSSNEYSCHFNGNGRDFVLLNKDLIYHHKVICFHFTTYDVQRGTDIINPGTSRCNIMLLADQVNSAIDSSNLHRFLYAQVLSAYHANVIYTGPGMHDYEPCRFNFLCDGSRSWIWHLQVGRPLSWTQSVSLLCVKKPRWAL